MAEQQKKILLDEVHIDEVHVMAKSGEARACIDRLAREARTVPMKRTTPEEEYTNAVILGLEVLDTIEAAVAHRAEAITRDATGSDEPDR